MLMVLMCMLLLNGAAAYGYSKFPCCLPSGMCKNISTYWCEHQGGISPIAILSNSVEPEHYYYEPCDNETAALCPGACCYLDRCEWVTEEACEGLYRGNGTTCETDCSGACCTEGVCTRVQRADCAGTYQGFGTHCLAEGACPRSNWIIGVALLFAILFFLGAVILVLFVCRYGSR